MKPFSILTLAFVVAAQALCPPASASEAIGDTLTVIQRPLPNLPSLVCPGDTLTIKCAGGAQNTGWAAELRRGDVVLPMEMVGAGYASAALWWTLRAVVPEVPVHELWDLRVTADGGTDDTARDAVQVLPEIPESYYFLHVTDLHLPDHRFSSDGATPADSTELADLRAVIEDANLIDPLFVVITGDIVNEGELEDHLEWRSFTRAQRVLREFDVPVFLTAGNHDIGGWDATPPADGTARRNWWRFFGWPRLAEPPEGAPFRTQDYSFDLGRVHYTALEAYDNYDGWRWSIYGDSSYIPAQLDWLAADLAAAAGRTDAQVLLHHHDFLDQLDLAGLGIEMALWGHIHDDAGSLWSQPYDLATDAVCDGQRSYRLVRVDGATLTPRPTRRAGATGANLRVAYEPANDGQADVVTATVVNGLGERFEHGRLRVLMPAGGTYVATGGAVVQVDETGPVPVVHVAVDILASSTTTVTVTRVPTEATAAAGLPSVRIAAVQPNPCNPRAEISFDLPAPSSVDLRVYDVTGRAIRTLIAGETRDAGRHRVGWDGADDRGRPAAAGVYRVVVEAGGRGDARSLTLIR